jgi:hypothetical protein
MGKVLEREFLETKEQIHEWIKVNTCGKNEQTETSDILAQYFVFPVFFVPHPIFLTTVRMNDDESQSISARINPDLFVDGEDFPLKPHQ